MKKSPGVTYIKPATETVHHSSMGHTGPAYPAAKERQQALKQTEQEVIASGKRTLRKAGL